MTIDPTNVSGTGLVDRVKNILLTPGAEWDRIDAEPADVNKIYIGYVLPLVALSAICGFIGMSVFGVSAFGVSYRVPMVNGLVSAVLQVGLGMLGVFVLAFIANALAPTFASQQNMGQAHKLAAYGSTAGFLAGVFAIFPPLAILGLVGLYSLYLLYVGLPKMMKTPEDKRVGYLATIVIVAIVVWLVIGMISGAVMRAVPGYGPPGYNFSENARAVSDATHASIDLGAIEREMPQWNGPPVNPSRLQDQLPQTLPGGFVLATQSTRTADNQSRAEGVYESGAARLNIAVVHLGNIEAASTFAAGIDAQVDRRDAGGYARTQSIDGRLYSEEVNNDGSASYAVIGRGVAVSAEGTGGVTLDQARAAIEIIDMQRLEREFGA